MKKILLFLTIITVTFLLASCSADIDENLIRSEFNRIKELLPSEFDEDFKLPVASGSFDIVYSIEGVEIEDGFMVYELLPYNVNIVISITISNEELSEEYYLSIAQIGNYGLYYEFQIDIISEGVFNRIESYIPDILTSNLTLPEFNIEGVSVLYSTDCSEIVRNRVVYTFPSTNTDCIISVEVSNSDGIRYKDIEVVMSSVNELPRIPEIHINTVGNEPITNNYDYIPASLSVVGAEYPRFIPVPEASLGIRLRGNSTLGMPKLSFKLKFDEKQKFFSLYEEKDWVLLANFSDQTLIRNYLAFSMSSKLNLNFTPKYTFVDVYINGDYQGNYLLTDQIEVTNDRVDIEENVPDIDTGYLIELDKGLYRLGLENTDENYFLIDGIPFIIKSPEFDDSHYQDEHFTYIKNYMTDVYNTLKNQENYSNLIDEDSFIDWFIVNEVFKNVDSGYSSVYFYKDKGGKLKMGPVWDFDLSTGNQGHADEDSRGPIGWYTPREDKNIFFYYLMQYPSFQHKLKERWNEVYDDIILTTLDQVFYVSDSITYSRYQNFIKWDIIGINNQWYTATEIYDLKTYDLQVWFLYDYLEERIEWLNEEINLFD